MFCQVRRFLCVFKGDAATITAVNENKGDIKMNHENIILKQLLEGENVRNPFSKEGWEFINIYEYYLKCEKYFPMRQIYKDTVVKGYYNFFRDSIDLKGALKKYHKFNPKDSKTKFKLSFVFLKTIDDILYGGISSEESLEYILFKSQSGTPQTGLLIIGKKVWAEKDFSEGLSPFTSLRCAFLSKGEENQFNTLKKETLNISLFNNNIADVVVSNSDIDYNLQMIEDEKHVEEMIGSLKGIDVKINDISHYDDKPIEKKCAAVTKDAIVSTLKKATANTKIIAFPEMMIDSYELNDAIRVIKESIKENNLQSLEIIIIGVHKHIEKTFSYENYAAILCKAKDWGEIAHYTKLIPATFWSDILDVPVVENLYHINEKEKNLDAYNDNDEITLLPFTDCVVGIAICSDVMDILNTDSPLHSYVDIIDILIVISCNETETNMFVGAAECLARWHNCGVVYTNNVSCCESQKGLIELSFAITPFKAKSGSISSITGAICYNMCPIDLNAAGSKSIEYFNVNHSTPNAVYRLSKVDKVEYQVIQSCVIIKMQISDTDSQVIGSYYYNQGQQWRSIANEEPSKKRRLYINDKDKIVYFFYGGICDKPVINRDTKEKIKENDYIDSKIVYIVDVR